MWCCCWPLTESLFTGFKYWQTHDGKLTFATLMLATYSSTIHSLIMSVNFCIPIKTRICYETMGVSPCLWRYSCYRSFLSKYNYLDDAQKVANHRTPYLQKCILLGALVGNVITSIIWAYYSLWHMYVLHLPSSYSGKTYWSWGLTIFFLKICRR